MYPGLVSKNLPDIFPPFHQGKGGKTLLILSGDKKLPNGFCEYISKLHNCPASSGSIKRIFSTFGFVWSKVRNRLGSDKAQKLVKIYRFYRNTFIPEVLMIIMNYH